MITLLHRIKATAQHCLAALRQRLATCTRPSTASVAVATLADLTRSKPELVAENALLRHQLVILQRREKRPAFTRLDRALLVLLASRVRTWRDALLLVQPETLLRWHRQGLRLFWTRKSARRHAEPRLSVETIALIKEMASANRLWGAERIRGELLKLDIHVAKRTIQKYMRQARPPRRSGQTWSSFLHNHAHDIWACDFLPVTDLLFRPIYAFFVVELARRRVVHVGVTRHPTDVWVAQQLREATPFGHKPKYLIRDNDSKFGPVFAHVADISGIEILCTAYRAPKMNAICERFLGSVRRECLDHLFILGERHLRHSLREYVRYFNHARPHQGLRQEVPERPLLPATAGATTGTVVALPVLGGLHHAYRKAG